MVNGKNKTANQKINQEDDIEVHNLQQSSLDTHDTWRAFFNDFAVLFKNKLLLKDTIAVSIFALFNILCTYFLGDFLTKGSFAGIAITIVAISLLTILSIIQMRRIINQAIAIFQVIPFAFCFALLIMIIVFSNIMSAIVLLIFSSSTIGQGFMGGSLVSMILMTIVFCFYAFWIFLWKRVKWRKKK